GNIEVGQATVETHDTPASPDEADVVAELRYIYAHIKKKNLLESYNDALQRKEEAISRFKLGILSLEDRAKAENLFWEVCQKMVNVARTEGVVHEELQAVEKQLAEQYLCNFSLFQSMPDH